MAHEILLEEHSHPGVVVLRLNRPEVLNALNLDLRRALAAAFDQLDGDDTVRVVVLTGNERAFCAGADLNEYLDVRLPWRLNCPKGRAWRSSSSSRPFSKA
ncbi:MAG: enoyl-CoA hydratase-related protein [Castellaniella sp.]|uniref:enoyl-CoA hydratase-related protein n=1 Tax=Castellaniella sp. TaxID=1955812 RepID=UPI003C79194D